MSARIIYDGDCPFCSAYVRMLRLRESIGPVDLVNAREHPEVAKEMHRLGAPLDDGMVLELGGKRYHGDACVQRLALLSTRSGVFNRLNAAIFSRPHLTRILYPVMRAGRNATLRLLGVKKLHSKS